MTATIKTQKFWLISNLIGLLIYLWVASATWDLNHELGGLFLEYAVLNLLLPIFIVFNSIWLILIFFRFRHSKIIPKLVLLAIVVTFWVGVRGIEIHEAKFWYEQAQKELNENNGEIRIN